MKYSYLFKLILAFFICVAMSSNGFAESSANVWSVSSLDKLWRNGANLGRIDKAKRTYLELAKNEAESFQIVIDNHGQPVSQGHFSITPMINTDGVVLDMRWHEVDYVRTGSASYATEHVGWWSDILKPQQSEFSIRGNRIGAFWITLTASADQPAGIYRGNVEVTIDGKLHVIPVQANVRKFKLPKPGNFATPFGVYAKFLSKHYYDNIKPEECLSIDNFMRWANILDEYRMAPKNIGFEYRQINFQENAHGINVISSVDLTNLKNTVGVIQNKVPPYSFCIYRMASGFTIEKWLKEKTPGKTPQDVAAPVNKILKEWKALGFRTDQYIYGFDEPKAHNPELIKFIEETYKYIKRENPEVKIMQTIGAPAPKLAGLVDIWCAKLDVLSKPFFQERKKKGDTLWSYVCISPTPPTANLCVDEPAIDHRMLVWHARKFGAEGFLYWAVNGWTDWAGRNISKDLPIDATNPIDYRDHLMYNLEWQNMNGDGVLLYAGPNLEPWRSVRIEVMRDAIEDYEYFELLEKLTAKVKAIPIFQKSNGIRIVRAAENLLTIPDSIVKEHNEFNQDPTLMMIRRREIGDMIEQMLNILEDQDYKKWVFYKRQNAKSTDKNIE
ncbi:glycoside hydrolase domain-containing protein [Poriferisphaera corsica]|nr:glycoside hydrolase domain-containing protein [Poriferisphaera corsica]